MNHPASQARQKAGYSTLEAAARRAKLTPRTLAKYERGDGPSLGIARKLGRLYGCSPFLFTRQAAGFADR
jgi:transcriptional regulator with XRE-family HTH domain